MSKACCDTKMSLQSQVEELTQVVNQTAIASHHNTNLLLGMIQQQQLILVYLLEKLEISADELQAFAAAVEDSEDAPVREQEEVKSETATATSDSGYPAHAAIFGG